MLSTGAGERLTSTQPVQLDISAVVRFERAIHLSGPVVAGPQDVVLRSCPSTPDVVVGPVRWIAPIYIYIAGGLAQQRSVRDPPRIELRVAQRGPPPALSDAAP